MVISCMHERVLCQNWWHFCMILRQHILQKQFLIICTYFHLMVVGGGREGGGVQRKWLETKNMVMMSVIGVQTYAVVPEIEEN